MISEPEWYEIRTWTEDNFGFVPENARLNIIKLLDWLDNYSEALMDMVNQHCQGQAGLVVDSGLSANEDAFFLLEDDKLLEETSTPNQYRLLWKNIQAK